MMQDFIGRAACGSGLLRQSGKNLCPLLGLSPVDEKAAKFPSQAVEDGRGQPFYPPTCIAECDAEISFVAPKIDCRSRHPWPILFP
jgi:hypothetical protein